MTTGYAEIATGGPMAWGLHTAVDLYGCDLDTMTDADAIRRFAAELVELLDMEAFGDPVVEFFGCGEWKPGDPEDEKPDTAGFTLTQLIQTSLISAHFADKKRLIILDVCSCKHYLKKIVIEHARKFFGAKMVAVAPLNRGAFILPGEGVR